MPHRLDDVACACLTLCADHGSAFADAPQCLTQVACAANKGHGEEVFVDMEMLIGRRQNLRLVDAVNANSLQNLGLDKVPNATLRHDGDGDSLFDLHNQFGVAHTGDATLRSNIGGHTLQCHYCRCTRFLCDTCMVCVDDITDHSTLEHLWKISLDKYRSCIFLHK